MTTSKQISPGWILLVLFIVWLFFLNGITTIRQWSASGAPAGIVSTISRGAFRALATPAGIAPPANPAAPPAAPPIGTGSSAPPAVDTVSQAQIQQQADAAYHATAQASLARGNVASAPVLPIQAASTAVVLIPTAVPLAQAVVVPDTSKPIVYAQSGPMLETAVPTMTYPTPLPAAAAAYTLSPDGKCVTAARSGALFQVCQDWPYKDAEARTVADYIRSGRLSGVAVQ